MVQSVAQRPDSKLAYDPEQDMVFLEGRQVALNGIIEDVGSVTLSYTVGGFYDEIGGKFSKLLGNVAIVDCNYFADSLFPALREAIKPLRLRKPLLFFEYEILINQLESEL